MILCQVLVRATSILIQGIGVLIGWPSRAAGSTVYGLGMKTHAHTPGGQDIIMWRDDSAFSQWRLLVASVFPFPLSIILNNSQLTIIVLSKYSSCILLLSCLSNFSASPRNDRHYFHALIMRGAGLALGWPFWDFEDTDVNLGPKYAKWTSVRLYL